VGRGRGQTNGGLSLFVRHIFAIPRRRKLLMALAQWGFNPAHQGGHVAGVEGSEAKWPSRHRHKLNTDGPPSALSTGTGDW